MNEISLLEKKRLEIIHVGPTSPGGMDTVIRFLAKSFSSSRVISTRAHAKRKIFHNAIIYLMSVVEIFTLRRSKNRIFHIHTTKNGSLIRKFIISLILRARGEDYIVHMHAGSLGWFRLNVPFVRHILFAYLSAARYVVVLSEFWKEYYSHKFPSLSNIHVVSNPCECVLQIPPRMKEKKKIKFLYAGTFVVGKGVFDLIDAFSRLDADPDVELHMFGSGDTESLRKHIDQSAKNESVFLHCWLPHDEYLSTIELYDVFVLPSYAEGMPMSILEAMGHAMPIIASNVGGIPTLVTNGVNGYLIDAGDIDSLSEAMRNISSNPSLRAAMGFNSWKIATGFSSESVLSKWTRLYSAMY
jgi:glycosyltransferase involved in cell wall biosynthesis